jgi:hypothetical protein
MSGRPSTALVHVQIDRGRPLAWTLAQRHEAAQAVLAFGQAAGADRLQVDFEVRRSEHGVLLDLLSDVRRGLPKTKQLSMTALASWCETETWLDAAPVDEIVPMLFRMGPDAVTDLTCLGECGRGSAPLRTRDVFAAGAAKAAAERAMFFKSDHPYDKAAPTPPPGAVAAWDEILVYAQAHPADPRIPETLYWLVHVGHFGGSHNQSGKTGVRTAAQPLPQVHLGEENAVLQRLRGTAERALGAPS